jgi:hypothetical protein
MKTKSEVAVEKCLAGYNCARSVLYAFEKRHGSSLCRVLLDGCDLRTAEGQQHFKEHDLLHKTCVGCVRSVVESLAQILDAPEAQAGGGNKS